MKTIDFLFSLWEEEEEEEKQLTANLLACLPSILGSQRESYYVKDRMDWATHVYELNQESPRAFSIMYRMEYSSFLKLVDLIDISVRKNGAMAEIRAGTKCGLITTEIALHCALRWLAGGSYIDVRLIARISKSSFYDYAHRCIQAINDCEDLKYKFPTTPLQVKNHALGFEEISSHGIFQTCVAAVDGILIRTITPARTHVGNVRSFYSGHYKANGINVQCACDSMCRFVYMSALSPGGTNDALAYRTSTLPALVESLPSGYFIVGDAAYTAGEHLLTPYSGGARINPKHDTYNYYISQLRIRIECSFGRCVNKFRLFRSPLTVHIKNVAKMFYCATLLHNFCINEKEVCEPFDPNKDRPLPEAYYDQPQVETVRGTSTLRNIMVNRIHRKGLERPAENIVRNGRR